MLQIAVLISGSGSNLQSLIDCSQSYSDKFEIYAVLSDREAPGLKKAEKAGIITHLLDRNIGLQSLSEQINTILEGKVDYIVLAGFLSILEESFIGQWEGKIINIHPSLLPEFGGRGMYGIHVHESVLKAGVPYSGCTVHYVDSGIDTGKIIKQRSLEVNPQWNPSKLQQEVLKLEHRLLPETVLYLCEKGKLK